MENVMSERKELQPVEVVRDAEGYWTHPDLEELLTTANEEFATAAEWNAFKQQQNIETRNISFDGDAGNGDPDISSWNPAKPEGHGWFMLSLHDTEDGALCIWARKSRPFAMFNRDEKFEIAYENTHKPIVTRPYPKLEDGSYQYLEIAQAWDLWQAATALVLPEGYVVVKPALDSAAKCKMIGEYTFRVNDTDTLITVPWTTIKQIYKGGIECMIQAALESDQ